MNFMTTFKNDTNPLDVLAASLYKMLSNSCYLEQLFQDKNSRTESRKRVNVLQMLLLSIERPLLFDFFLKKPYFWNFEIPVQELMSFTLTMPPCRSWIITRSDITDSPLLHSSVCIGLALLRASYFWFDLNSDRLHGATINPSNESKWSAILNKLYKFSNLALFSCHSTLIYCWINWIWRVTFKALEILSSNCVAPFRFLFRYILKNSEVFESVPMSLLALWVFWS